MKISIEAARFQKYLLKYQKEVQQDTEKAVKTAAELFARSAARHSPPNPGKRISRYSVTRDEKGNVIQKRDMFNRSIRAAVYVDNGGWKIYFAGEKAKKYLNKSGMKLNRSGKAGKLLVEYVVMAKVAGNRSFIRKIFDSLSAAKEAARITTRGLLRAGWWGASRKLGGKVDEQYGQKVASLVSSVSDATQKKTDSSVTVSVINSVNIPGAASAAPSAIAYGLGKASNQLRAMIRKAISARAGK